MADPFDHASELETAEREHCIAAARGAAASIPDGEPGECEACVEDSPRLIRVDGLMMCARCRDKREKRR